MLNSSLLVSMEHDQSTFCLANPNGTLLVGSANQMIIAWEIPNKTSEEINQPMELDPCWETSTSATVAAVPAVVQFNPRRALLCASGKYTTMWLPPKPTDDSSD